MVKAVLAVRDHSQASTPARRAVLLVLASYADEDGANAFPSWTTLCAKTGVTRKTVGAALSEAVNHKEIVSTGERKRGTKVYSFASFINRFPQGTSSPTEPVVVPSGARLVSSVPPTGSPRELDQVVPSKDQTTDQALALGNGHSSDNHKPLKEQLEKEEQEATLSSLRADLKRKPGCKITARAIARVEEELAA